MHPLVFILNLEDRPRDWSKTRIDPGAAAVVVINVAPDPDAAVGSTETQPRDPPESEPLPRPPWNPGSPVFPFRRR